MATLMSKHRTSQPSKRLQSLQFTFFSPTPCTVSGEMLPGSLMGRPSTIPRPAARARSRANAGLVAPRLS